MLNKVENLAGRHRLTGFWLYQKNFMALIRNWNLHDFALGLWNQSTDVEKAYWQDGNRFKIEDRLANMFPNVSVVFYG